MRRDAGEFRSHVEAPRLPARVGAGLLPAAEPKGDVDQQRGLPLAATVGFPGHPLAPRSLFFTLLSAIGFWFAAQSPRRLDVSPD